MQVWHGTPDAPQPQQFRPGEIIDIVIGTWPIEPGQEVTVELTISSRSRKTARGTTRSLSTSQ